MQIARSEDNLWFTEDGRSNRQYEVENVAHVMFNIFSRGDHQLSQLNA